MCFARVPRRIVRGQTLLELVVASVLLATTLVPALRLMRNGMNVGREIETAGVLNTFCISEMEHNMVLGAADWSTGTVNGSLASYGYPNLRFEVVRSDDPANGGINNQLMAIISTVWEDANGNDAWDNGEMRVVYATKIANMSGYQESAGG